MSCLQCNAPWSHILHRMQATKGELCPQTLMPAQPEWPCLPASVCHLHIQNENAHNHD